MQLADNLLEVCLRRFIESSYTIWAVRVGDWLNAWCPADAVAIGCPLRDDWGEQLTEVVTDSPKERCTASRSTWPTAVSAASSAMP